MLSRRWQGATRKGRQTPQNSHHQANREQGRQHRPDAIPPGDVPRRCTDQRPNHPKRQRTGEASHHQTSIRLEVGVDPRASEQYKREGDDKDQAAQTSELPAQRSPSWEAWVRDTLLETMARKG